MAIIAKAAARTIILFLKESPPESRQMFHIKPACPKIHLISMTFLNEELLHKTIEHRIKIAGLLQPADYLDLSCLWYSTQFILFLLNWLTFLIIYYLNYIDMFRHNSSILEYC